MRDNLPPLAEVVRVVFADPQVSGVKTYENGVPWPQNAVMVRRYMRTAAGVMSLYEAVVEALTGFGSIYLDQQYRERYQLTARQIASIVAGFHRMQADLGWVEVDQHARKPATVRVTDVGLDSLRDLVVVWDGR